MFPASADMDTINHNIRDAKLLSNSNLGHARLQQSPNLINIFVSEFGIAVRFTLEGANSPPIFLKAVTIISEAIPKPKVRWIAAISPVATGAIMQYAETLWDGAIMKNPTKPMRQFPCEISVGKLKHPVARLMETANPKPASPSFIKPSQKTLAQGIWTLAQARVFARATAICLLKGPVASKGIAASWAKACYLATSHFILLWSELVRLGEAFSRFVEPNYYTSF